MSSGGDANSALLHRHFHFGCSSDSDGDDALLQPSAFFRAPEKSSSSAMSVSELNASPVVADRDGRLGNTKRRSDHLALPSVPRPSTSAFSRRSPCLSSSHIYSSSSFAEPVDLAGSDSDTSVASVEVLSTNPPSKSQEPTKPTKAPHSSVYGYFTSSSSTSGSQGGGSGSSREAPPQRTKALHPSVSGYSASLASMSGSQGSSSSSSNPTHSSSSSSFSSSTFGVPSISCGGKFLSPAQISASTFRRLNALETSTSFSSMLDAKESLTAASKGLFDIKLGTSRSSNSKTGHTHHCECTSGTDVLCKWKRVFELCISCVGEYVWFERRGKAIDDHTHELLVQGPPKSSVQRKPAVAAPAPDQGFSACSYTRDPSNSETKVFHARTAPTSNASCIRCLKNIETGDLKLMFETFDRKENHPVTRGYHPVCFKNFPPSGVDLSSFEIKWDSSKRDAVCEERVEIILRGVKKRKALDGIVDLT